jgi:hypothetical protein
VVVDGLEIFGFHHIGVDAAFGIEAGGDIADHVFDEFGIVVGALGDVFLIRALEQAEEFAGSFGSTSWTSSSIHTKSLVRAVTVTCERWLWAPYSEIFLEQGQRLVTGTTTLTEVTISPWRCRR